MGEWLVMFLSLLRITSAFAFEGRTGLYISECIVLAGRELRRITRAALPVKAPNSIGPSTSRMISRVMVVLPVPA